ncbi:MAG TPA: glycoside hydrolase family 30 protein [Verrucomicrobiae bacterium]|jgi:glucosylceramidase|nr:glycoside hydrolase family 30 protein [Verrucomicrobiae bacterium]
MTKTFFALAAAASWCIATAVAAPVEVYLTAKDSTNRLSKMADADWVSGVPVGEKEEWIFIDPAKTFQTVLGIGGALTDAAAETFYKLPKAKQEEILRAYFDPQHGIGYTLGRTHIHSCDFSSESYTYVKDGDTSLASFDIAHDLKYRVPFTQAVLKTAGPGFTIFASPWSPPAWMKDNNNMLHGGKLKPEFYDTWARYYGKFIHAYEHEGIPIWGLTVQNEPLANQTWESCIYSAEDERDFVKNHLGPALRQAGLGDKKIIVWDHNRSLMFTRAATVLDDPQAAQYVWGVGYHWYVGDHFDNVRRVKEAYPATHLLFTEGCRGPYDFSKINDWDAGEAYGKSMVEDFNNGVEGWTDWNVLLDEQGGPNHVQNFCFAPLHGDTKTGELHYMNSFYYIGHFSKFVRPGARRIISSSSTDRLTTTAFVNKDGKIAVEVLNLTDEGQPFNLRLHDKITRHQSPAHSIMTLLIK